MPVHVDPKPSWQPVAVARLAVVGFAGVGVVRVVKQGGGYAGPSVISRFPEGNVRVNAEFRCVDPVDDRGRPFCSAADVHDINLHADRVQVRLPRRVHCCIWLIRIVGRVAVVFTRMIIGVEHGTGVPLQLGGRLRKLHTTVKLQVDVGFVVSRLDSLPEVGHQLMRTVDAHNLSRAGTQQFLGVRHWHGVWGRGIRRRPVQVLNRCRRHPRTEQERGGSGREGNPESFHAEHCFHSVIPTN